jgi:hypothetical protein
MWSITIYLYKIVVVWLSSCDSSFLKLYFNIITKEKALDLLQYCVELLLNEVWNNISVFVSYETYLTPTIDYVNLILFNEVNS